MYNQFKQFRAEQAWFERNIVTAAKTDIKKSKELHCGIPMEEYTGTQFVDWTHRCTKCKAMYGCA
jgi:hypothetical protein